MAFPVIGGVKPWYSYKRIDNFGQYPDPVGNYPKPDSNILCPAGTSITCITPGTVTSVRVQPWGNQAYSITIRLTTPQNSVATHASYNYVEKPVVSPGQKVSFGDPLATAGNPYNIGTSFAFTDTDVYGAGSVNEPFTGTYVNPLLNPVPFLNSLAAGGGSGSGSGGGSGAQNITNALSPTEDVVGLLVTFDQVFALTNPFTISGVQQDSIAGVTFTDPMAWLGQFGQNVVDDLTALVLRFFFLLLALFIFYKVFSAFIDFGAIGQAAQTVAKGAMLAV